jgi:hypothetical protein
VFILKFPRVKLKYDARLSNFAFNSNLRRCTKVAAAAVCGREYMFQAAYVPQDK